MPMPRKLLLSPTSPRRQIISDNWRTRRDVLSNRRRISLRHSKPAITAPAALGRRSEEQIFPSSRASLFRGLRHRVGARNRESFTVEARRHYCGQQADGCNDNQSDLIVTRARLYPAHHVRPCEARKIGERVDNGYARR